MSVKRYSYQPRYTTYEGEFGGYMDEDEDGEFVRYTMWQAQQELIEKLKADIEKLSVDHITSGDLGALYNSGYAMACSYWGTRLTNLLGEEPA